MRFADSFIDTMRRVFLGNAGNPARNMNEGGRLLSEFEAVGVVLEEESLASDGEYLGLYVQSAVGDVLRARGRELGVEPKPDTPASFKERFTAPAGTEIPANTIFSTPTDKDPVAEAKTLASATVPEGATYVDVDSKAMVAGLGGNREADEYSVLITGVEGVTDVTNPARATGGTVESDQAYRNRCQLRWSAIGYGGTVRMFESTALEVPGIAEAVVIPVWAGPSTVKVLVWSQDANGDLAPASAGLVAAVQAYFGDARRPCCCSVTVAAPVGPVINVFQYLALADDAVWTTVYPLARNALLAYFAGLPGGTTRLPRAALAAAVMAVPGVVNVRTAKPFADVVVPEGSGPLTLGRLELQAMTWDSDVVA